MCSTLARIVFFGACLKVNHPDGLCDVCDEVSEARVAQIGKGPAIYKQQGEG
jgi:hypothetical protein